MADPKFDPEDYLRAYNEGASRSRKILFFMMFASLASMLAFVNAVSPESNWFRSRIEVSRTVRQWAVFPDDDSLMRVLPQQVFILETSLFDTLQKRIVRQKLDTCTNLMDITALKQNIFRRSPSLDSLLNEGKYDMELPDENYPPHLLFRVPRHLLERWSVDTLVLDLARITPTVMQKVLGGATSNYGTRAELEWAINYMNRAFIDNSMLVDTPFLTANFDINSLAAYSALTFGIGYFLLFFSVGRERKNLELMFRNRSRFGATATETYQLLSMDQVLTIPPGIDKWITKADPDGVGPALLGRSGNRYLRWFTHVPFAVPLGVWLSIYAWDWNTASLGTATNPGLLKKAIWIDGTAGGILVVLFISASVQYIRLANEWRFRSEAVRKEQAVAKDMGRTIP